MKLDETYNFKRCFVDCVTSAHGSEVVALHVIKICLDQMFPGYKSHVHFLILAIFCEHFQFLSTKCNSTTLRKSGRIHCYVLVQIPHTFLYYTSKIPSTKRIRQNYRIRCPLVSFLGPIVRIY